ncbi:MAG: hypothetical protein HZA02_08920 [Nitrospinae bacterium]|nr:hypothetical protein [Nitrospinota bacterium]
MEYFILLGALRKQDDAFQRVWEPSRSKNLGWFSISCFNSASFARKSLGFSSGVAEVSWRFDSFGAIVWIFVFI